MASSVFRDFDVHHAHAHDDDDDNSVSSSLAAAAAAAASSDNDDDDDDDDATCVLTGRTCCSPVHADVLYETGGGVSAVLRLQR